jgi:hypothetical protein
LVGYWKIYSTDKKKTLRQEKSCGIHGVSERFSAMIVRKNASLRPDPVDNFPQQVDEYEKYLQRF